MIVTSLCWKNSEWIGLSLACSIDDILESVASGVLVKPARSIMSSQNHTGMHICVVLYKVIYCSKGHQFIYLTHIYIHVIDIGCAEANADRYWVFPELSPEQ